MWAGQRFAGSWRETPCPHPDRLIRSALTLAKRRRGVRPTSPVECDGTWADRIFLVAILSLAALICPPSPHAVAHAVACTNDAQQPFFNPDPAPGRAVVQGATIIECSPTRPDSQRTEVQLQILLYRYWRDRGTSYVTYTNAQFHRVYDSTTCREDLHDSWRTKAIHTGTHGNSKTKIDWSVRGSFPCYYNV